MKPMSYESKGGTVVRAFTSRALALCLPEANSCSPLLND